MIRKISVLFLALAFISVAFAQDKVTPISNTNKAVFDDGLRGTASPLLNLDGTPVLISKMWNAYSTQASFTNQIYYDTYSNIISVVHRTDLTGAGSGRIVYNVSDDIGATWSPQIGPINDPLYLNGRHPNIVLSNPTKSSDPGLVTAVMGYYQVGASGGFDIGVWAADALGAGSATTFGQTDLWSVGDEAFVNNRGYAYFVNDLTVTDPGDGTVQKVNITTDGGQTWNASSIGFASDYFNETWNGTKGDISSSGNGFIMVQGQPAGIEDYRFGWKATTDDGDTWDANWTWVNPYDAAYLGGVLGDSVAALNYEVDFIVQGSANPFFVGTFVDTIDGTATGIYVISNMGGGWKAELMRTVNATSLALAGGLTTLNNVEFARSEDGTVVCVKYGDLPSSTDTNFDMFVRWFDGTSWSAEENITNTPAVNEVYQQTAPRLHFDGVDTYKLISMYTLFGPTDVDEADLVFVDGVTFQSTPVATADVTFQVDMGVQASKGRFTIGDPVKLAGNFNGWNNGADVMTDVDGDTIYTITKTLNVGDTLFFKFIKGADTWENDPNREYVVPASNSTYYDFFDRDNQYAVPVTIDITFACNMELEIASGRFNPTTDTLSVRGSFNGWGANDLMFQSTTDPNVYDGTFSVNTYEGETINYKFAYFGPNGTTWENDPNKTYTVTADDITFGAAFIERGFNNLDLSNVTNFPVTIKFTVNMAGAISSINLQPFPSIDDVRLCGANAPLQWPDGGWPNADSIRTIKLYDNGTNGDVTAGDNVWSREVIFPQYSPLSIQYKYGANWGLASNNGGNDNENGVGADHFITLTPDLVSATVVNVFGTMGTHPLVDIVTDVNEIKDLVPVVYELGQNYPNPFNPSTTIKFSIPESGMVTLRVFNMLGQEVATLLNSEKTAGVYEASFDASALSSGIYFYTLDSKNFTSTKKMVLLK